MPEQQQPSAGPEAQVPTDDNMADLLQQSIDQANAKKGAPAPVTTQPSFIQSMTQQRGAGRIDPFSVHGLNISKLRTEMAQATDPADRQAFQDAIDREIALARGDNPPLIQQAEAENLPAKQPRTVEPSEQFPPKVPQGAGVTSPDQIIPASQLQRGQSGWVNPQQVGLDPKTFQFKQHTNAQGVQFTNPIIGQKFDPFLAGTVDVFKDDQGRLWATDGHHRTVSAQESNAPAMHVQVMDTNDPQVARARAALKNIASGQGTAFDAAVFLKDSGASPDTLKQNNISLNAPKVQQGLALASLDEPLLRKVGNGEISESRGVALAKATDPAIQHDVLAEVERRERAGKNVSDLTVAELARLAQEMGTNTQQTMSLFGPELRTTSGLMDVADMASHIRREIARKRTAFGAVANKARAQMLNEAGNVIDPDTNQRISQEAAQALQIFDKEMLRQGPINQILQEGAKKLRNGGNSAKIKADAAAAVEKELSKTVSALNGSPVGGGQQGTGAGAGQGTGDAGTGAQGLTAGFFGDKK